ncbi:MAG: biotin--[acetyl-CoA-carboxylase] ligase [Clostridia bacterium]
MALKNDVLRLLEEHRGESISGQEIAGLFGVSRNAVWKVMCALKKSGYQIASVNNKGYTLAEDNDQISPEGIAFYLSPAYCALEICAFDTIDSTNSEAKRRIAAGLAETLLVVAGCQTSGRGRRGRSFYSPADTGIYMTLAFHVRSRIEDVIRLTAAAAVAVVRAIERLTMLHPEIKWVNDIYLNHRKICGILTEGVTDFEAGTVDHVLIGIGLNVSTKIFPAEIQTIAASLNTDEIPRNRWIAEITNALLALIEAPDNGAFMNDYRRCSLVIGKRIIYTRGETAISAEAIGIDDDGGLMVRHDDGTTATLKSGEITLRLQEQL